MPSHTQSYLFLKDQPRNVVFICACHRVWKRNWFGDTFYHGWTRCFLPQEQSFKLKNFSSYAMSRFPQFSCHFPGAVLRVPLLCPRLYSIDHIILGRTDHTMTFTLGPQSRYIIKLNWYMEMCTFITVEILVFLDEFSHYPINTSVDLFIWSISDKIWSVANVDLIISHPFTIAPFTLSYVRSCKPHNGYMIL